MHTNTKMESYVHACWCLRFVHQKKMKGTKVLTLGAVGMHMYTPIFPWFHELPTHTCASLWEYIITRTCAYTHATQLER